MKLLKSTDQLILLCISIIAVLITAMDAFGLSSKLPFLQEMNYSQLGVTILAFIGLHLTLSFRSQVKTQEDLEVGIEKIIGSLNGVKIEVFDSISELEDYMARRIDEAKKEICDLSWKNTISRTYSLPSRNKSLKTYETSIARISEKCIYREIFVFNDQRRIDKLRKRIDENKVGYFCRYFEDICDIPRIQFVIVDNEELFFASSSYPHYCAIKHQQLVAIFKSYYDQIWGKSIPIKEGEEIFHDEIAKIIKEILPKKL